MEAFLCGLRAFPVSAKVGIVVGCDLEAEQRIYGDFLEKLAAWNASTIWSRMAWKKRDGWYERRQPRLSKD